MKNISGQLPNTYIFGGVKAPRNVSLTCPVCGKEIKLKTNRRGMLRYRGVTCPSCDTDWICVPTDDMSAQLVRRMEINESAHCPACGQLNEFRLDNIAGGFVFLQCSQCGAPLNASRTRVGVTISVRTPAMSSETAPKLTEDFIAQVRALLPVQPWPKNIHKDVAEKLDTTPKRVSRAINTLIDREIFHDQKDGVIIYEAANEHLTDSTEGAA